MPCSKKINFFPFFSDLHELFKLLGHFSHVRCGYWHRFDLCGLWSFLAFLGYSFRQSCRSRFEFDFALWKLLLVPYNICCSDQTNISNLWIDEVISREFFFQSKLVKLKLLISDFVLDFAILSAMHLWWLKPTGKSEQNLLFFWN